MKECAAQWKEMKAANQTNGMKYRDFSKQCLSEGAPPAAEAKPAAAAPPPPAPPPPAAEKPASAPTTAAKPMSLTVQKGDVVELISGPFKGERAKVMRIDENKDELTVELTEVAVPIPVTIKASTIRLHQKAEANEEKKD